MVSDKLENELNNLRLKADNLAECLGSLLKRIEELEEAATNKTSTNLSDNILNNQTAKLLRKVAAAINNNNNNNNKNNINNCLTFKMENNAQVNQIDIHSINENKCLEIKKTPAKIFETAQTNLAFKQIESFEGWKDDKSHQIFAFEPRIVSINSNLIAQFEIKFFEGEAIVLKALREVMNLVRPGDSILEISGQLVTQKQQLVPPFGSELVTLKLVSSNLYSLPMNFCKILENYSTNNFNNKNLINPLSCVKLIDETLTEGIIDKNLMPSFNLKKGDVLQIISCDKTFMQARKVNDLSESGFVPLNVKMERVAMLSPYGRRVIVFLGANGVGRRKLKSMLIGKMSNYFATVVPVTSREPKPGEIDGHNFTFLLKEDFLKLIRNNQMIEWGEVNGYLYGTTADSVSQVIRSGRVCLLDCTEKALKVLYTREFMPYIVVIAAPPYAELMRLNETRAQVENCAPLQHKDIQKICDENDKLINGPYSNFFHLILINRNFDVTLRRLIDALEYLKTESQWIPLDWLT